VHRYVSPVAWRLALLMGSFFLSFDVVEAQLLSGRLFYRWNQTSNFDFYLSNDGTILEIFVESAWRDSWWPRGTRCVNSSGMPGIGVFAVKEGRHLFSQAGVLHYYLESEFGPFDGMVPGRIGDSKAGYDQEFHGRGWRYVDDPDYIVYSSLDYDSNGVDISGNNYNDWPIRLVNGERTYITNPLERRFYKPLYQSDEDMFCVFKDTDTRADSWYKGPHGPSVPIGVEVRLLTYSWRAGPGKDIVIFDYDILNKSGVPLDSCYLLYGSGAQYYINEDFGPRQAGFEVRRTGDELAYLSPLNVEQWSSSWRCGYPPTIGNTLLERPRGYEDSAPSNLRTLSEDSIVYYWDPVTNKPTHIYFLASDSIFYKMVVYPGRYYSPVSNRWAYFPLLRAGPFRMNADEKIRLTAALMFSDSLPHLHLMDEFIRRMWSTGLKRPSPPPPPRLTPRALNRSVALSWNNAAESATDEIIPDSLGRPFLGYRLLRSETQQGPYTQIGRWVTDSLLVHEYLDRGEDLAGGLKNNVRYYYRLLSFDEGAKKLKLDPMDSPPVEGVNSISVAPGSEPSNATSSPSDGNLASGILGDVGVPRLIPTSPTNFNNLISGRTLQVTLNASTDGTHYTIPVTIRDTVAGRVQNAIVDPGLFVHGSTATAGVKQGTGLIKDIFGIGAADVSVAYSFEQLADSFHIVPHVVSTQGADVPIVVTDSLAATGVETITPYTTAPKEIEVEFTVGGIDTISTLFHRYVPYLGVRVTEGGRELVSDTEYTFAPRGIRRTGGTSFAGKHSRYYLSGVISNGEEWDWGATLSMYESRIGFDYTDHGVGSGKPSPYFSWASTHRSGTKDFQAGDKVTLRWQGGVRAVFPRQATVLVEGAPGGRAEVTDAMMEAIRIVPNPYMIRHEAQRGSPVLYFNYLPQECTIRIYTVALDLVKTIRHSGGSIAHIETNSGKQVTKKFAVVMGE
jgi:hypothetical protein